MNSRTRHFKVFNRELEHYSPLMRKVLETQLECIPTNRLLSIRKELKRRGTFLKTAKELAEDVCGKIKKS